ncbi:MAG: hypothetical protein J6S85_26030 [Methanobrevibacter sp.]|nr:hypothetical protein [Methanobrevibacter sp.]MBO7717052.1 hypothetical protein [Methanobrevibacter sp.]
MANKVNAIVIDPETKTIYPTTVTKGSKGFHEIYEQIGCDNLEVGATMHDIGCIMYVDEEGWCHEGKRDTFKLDSVTVPSKAVIVKEDHDGYATEFDTGLMFQLINSLIDDIKWLGKKTYNEVFGDRDFHQYTEEESIAYYKKQFGCDDNKAKQMIKMFGIVMGY